MLEWGDVIPVVAGALGVDLTLLEFLTVLPEEVTEGRKVSLSVSISGKKIFYNPRLKGVIIGGRAGCPHQRVT